MAEHERPLPLPRLPPPPRMPSPPPVAAAAAPSRWSVKPGAWSPAAVVFVAAGIITAIGTSIVAPLAMRQPPPELGGLATKAEVAAVAADAAACRRAAGDALAAATAAESQAKGANEVAASAAAQRKGPPARRAAPPVRPQPLSDSPFP